MGLYFEKKPKNGYLFLQKWPLKHGLVFQGSSSTPLSKPNLSTFTPLERKTLSHQLILDRGSSRTTRDKKLKSPTSFFHAINISTIINTFIAEFITVKKKKKKKKPCIIRMNSAIEVQITVAQIHFMTFPGTLSINWAWAKGNQDIMSGSFAGYIAHKWHFLKGHWTTLTSFQFFFQKIKIFIPVKLSPM